MSRVFFARELETVATFWRILRRDGVALGFTSHNRDLFWDGLHYRAAPGMVPSAIRRTSDFEREGIEVEGVLSHDSISESDLAAGRYDHARIVIGLVDWETLERHPLVQGEMGEVSQTAGRFEAALASAKSSLDIDPVPRTSPTCRAAFGDEQCGVSLAGYTHLVKVVAHNPDTGQIFLSGAPAPGLARHGRVRWLEGPLAGTATQIIDADAEAITVDALLPPAIAAGQRLLLCEGCDHTLTTCHQRFANAANFRGEPFLPGNDLLTRHPGGPA